MNKPTKEDRIQNALDRMNKIYQDLPPDTYSVLRPLIENAAFLEVTLEDLAEDINANGPTEFYQNGQNQKGKKTSAALQSYDRLIKDYNNVMKTLSSRLPTVTVKYSSPVKEDLPEKTPAELHADYIESEKRTYKQAWKLAEASLLQLESWRSEGRITQEEYNRRADEERDRIERMKTLLQQLDDPEE